MAEKRDRWVNPHEGLTEVLEDRQSHEGVRVKLRQQLPILSRMAERNDDSSGTTSAIKKQAKMCMFRRVRGSISLASIRSMATCSLVSSATHPSSLPARILEQRGG
jgi:hypothetical protein